MTTKGHHHKQALCPVANRLVNRIFRVLRTGKPYGLRDLDGRHRGRGGQGDHRRTLHRVPGRPRGARGSTASAAPHRAEKTLAPSVHDHVALGLGLAACQKGLSVGFTTAAALVHELMEARDERRLLRLQKQMAGHKLLIIDELGFVPLPKTGAELLFELISQRYERGATLITSNLPFDEWTETFGSERLTGALLDRLAHHVTILEMNGDSYRLAQSRTRKTQAND